MIECQDSALSESSSAKQKLYNGYVSDSLYPAVGIQHRRHNTYGLPLDQYVRHIIEGDMGNTSDGEGGQPTLPTPPPSLFERLAQLPGYTWETNLRPFHSVGALMFEGGQSADVMPRHTIIGTSLDIGIRIRQRVHRPPNVLIRDGLAPPRARRD